MKIVLLNTAERTGGAAVAANRLMHALLKSGAEVTMLVRDRKTDDPHVVALNDSSWKKRFNLFRFIWERFIIFLCNRLNRKNLFQVSVANTGSDVSNHPSIQEADVIHLHWINQGFLSLNDIKKLIQTGKPIVWTLHDLWPVTAICHYPDQCIRYYKQCHHCMMQVKHPLADMAKGVFDKKKRIDYSKIHFVGCSEWIVSQAKRSQLAKLSSFCSIPNPIDIDLFHKMDKTEARKRFGLPIDRPLLLFAAAKVSDTRKGATYLTEACRLLKIRKATPFDIVLMGDSSDELINQFPCKVHTLGYISDLPSMVATYSCADLFVIPSLEDNLPNTIMEAMACGTPCVGFTTGGIPEMISHQQNGYLATYKDSTDLANGIEWVLTHNQHNELSAACLKKVNDCYRESVIAEKYINLYKQLICNNPHSQS